MTKRLRAGTPLPFTPDGLRQLRERRGVTQAEVARRMNLSQPRVHQIERNWECCTLPNLRAYCGALGLRLELIYNPTQKEGKK